ncbi:MAG: glycosyltransferase [Phycisphaeraceae bacterium]
MMLLELLLWSLAAVGGVPALIFAMEVLLCLLRPPALEERGDRPVQPVGEAVTVIVPAHNEQAMLPGTLAVLKREVRDPRSILVVADNCTDATAALAEAAGVRVLRRENRQRLGKSHALAAALQHLEADPPAVVAVVDADAQPAPGALRRITRMAQRLNRPVQGLYVFDQPASGNAKRAISWLAILFKNAIRPVGWARVGGPCLITGNAFAVPWALTRKVAFDNTALAEDTQLSVDFAVAGYPPVTCPTALVNSPMAPHDRAAWAQRTRWEQGHLHTMLTQIPRLLVHAVWRAEARLLLMAIDLLVPPLSLAALLWAGALAVTATAALTEGPAGPAVFLALCGGVMGGAVLAGWHRYARGVIRVADLLAVPWYVLWKVPIYARFLFARQVEWLRTDRS